MSRTILVKIEPKILAYARKFSGFNLEYVASRINIAQDILSDYEENGGTLTLSKLEKLSIIYKRPLSAFLLDRIPEDELIPRDYRVIYNSDEKSLMPEVLLSIRRGRYVQEFISDLSESKIEYKFVDVSLSNNIDRLAEWFRDFIAVEYSQQNMWPSPREVLNGFRAALEKKDIFVLQNSLGDGVSGFCLADKTPFVIMLNSSDNYTRRIFTMFHEIAHLLLHKSGICTQEEFGSKTYSYVQIEKFCNQFAASFLLPEDMFLLSKKVKELLSFKFSDWSNEIILDIARSFKLSREVILRRLLYLGFINEDQYNSKRLEWQKNPIIKQKSNKPIKIPQHILSISQNGHALTSFVLNNMYSNKISFSAAAEYLDIKPKHIANIEASI